METTRNLARATWFVPVVYLFASRFIGLVIGRVPADILVFVLAVIGVLLSVYCLIRIASYGRQGILVNAISGLLVCSLILAIWIPNFLAGRERVQAQREGKVVTISVESDGAILMNGRQASLDQVKVELRRVAAAGGTLRYSRANPKGEPSPNATAVMQAATEAKVRIQRVGE
ncbi:MAG TPA: hypothetical protein VN181_15115 [Thermoanaerobaculia bacterium]|nr:hypothetical protein [Thermoanaerobaculia bacterium]